MYGHEKRPLPIGDALDERHVYRLKEWPQIPERFRTAKVLRACSRMSVGPVTVSWFHEQIGLEPGQASGLVAELLAQGAIERIDFGSFGTPAAIEPAAAPVVATGVAGLRERIARRFAWKHAAA
jgi:hypothetical protein